jgi:Fic family protein
MQLPVAYHEGRFPPSTLDLGVLFPLVGPANAAIARYEGVLSGIPNPGILLSPLTAREAVLSSKIEGTQVTLGEVLEFEAQGHLFDESTPRKADAREVLNYRAALREAEGLMARLPLSQRLIKATHRVLMDGVRGRNKDPGNTAAFPTGSARKAAPSSRHGSYRPAPITLKTRWRAGRHTSMLMRPTDWCNWPLSTPSLKRFTPFSMATGASVG